MTDSSDRTLAQRLLETRECGYSFRLFYRRSAQTYLVILFMFGMFIAICAAFEIWALFCGLIGMLCGVLLRDVGWMRATARAWPFTLKVTDWEKVQRIADEKPAA